MDFYKKLQVVFWFFHKFCLDFTGFNLHYLYILQACQHRFLSSNTERYLKPEPLIFTENPRYMHHLSYTLHSLSYVFWRVLLKLFINKFYGACIWRKLCWWRFMFCKFVLCMFADLSIFLMYLILVSVHPATWYCFCTVLWERREWRIVCACYMNTIQNGLNYIFSNLIIYFCVFVNLLVGF